MHSDYSERRNTDFEHIVRGAEHSKKHMWYELKAGKANEEQTECCYQADLYCLNHTLSVLCTVVEGDDRCDSVVQSEYRHKEEALQFEINTAVDEKPISILFMAYVIIEPIDCMMIDGIPIA